MEAWRKVWREAIGPQLSGPGLRALAAGLERDDPCILQGATVSPPNMYDCAQMDAVACCPIGYACWQGDGRKSVAEVTDAFHDVVYAAGKCTHGELSVTRFFLNWVDDAPRDVMRRELLAEVRLELAKRDGAAIEALDEVAA